MNKKLLIFLITIIVILIGASYLVNTLISNRNEDTTNQKQEEIVTTENADEVKETVNLDNVQVILEDGSVADPDEFEVTRINPEDSYGEFISQGTRAYIKEDYQVALDWYLKAQLIEPGNFLAYYNAGNAYRSLNLISQAKDQFIKAIIYGPKEFPAYAALEEIYVVFLKDFDSAEKMYQDAIKKYPNEKGFSQAANNLAIRIQNLNQ